MDNQNNPNIPNAPTPSQVPSNDPLSAVNSQTPAWPPLTPQADVSAPSATSWPTPAAPPLDPVAPPPSDTSPMPAWPSDPVQTQPSAANTPLPANDLWNNTPPAQPTSDSPIATPNPWSTEPAPAPAPVIPDPAISPSGLDNTASPWSNNTPSQVSESPAPQPVQPATELDSATFNPPADPPAPVDPGFAPAAGFSANPEPMSTFTPPLAQSPQPSSSPSDNPLEASNQPPATDGLGSPIQPSWNSTPDSSAVNPASSASPQPTDSVPTDLSHLISGNSAQSESPQPAPETLVAPSVAPTPDVQTLPTGNHKGGMPRWLIGIAIILLLVVAGASAYFILGIGQPAKTTTSIPAETVAPVAAMPTSTPAPIATITPSGQPVVASGSANFGQLQPTNPPQATSAAELLRQRKQQQQP